MNDNEEEIPVWEPAFDRMPHNERFLVLRIADQLGKRQYFNALSLIGDLIKICVKNMGTLADERNKQKQMKHEESINELKKMLLDAKKNRLDEDPDEINEKWAGYIQGIEGAIYRLEMKSV